MREIIQHLSTKGYVVDQVTPDGNIHRFALNPQDNKKCGWYICYQNHTRDGELFYLIVSGDWRSGEQPEKYHTLKGKVSKEDREFIEKTTDRAMRKRQEARDAQWLVVAAEMEAKWQALETVGESAYLDRKQVSDCSDVGVRYDGFNGDIYVPLRDFQGKLWSMQKINRDGDKRFAPGGRVSGCFHRIGPNRNDKIYFAEGLATGLSIYLATSEPVICVFSAHSLKSVVKEFRLQYPEAELIIAGDDDASADTADNPGRTAAEAAAKESGAKAIFPRFTTEKGGDWNDLHCLEGLDAVRSQLSLLPARAEQKFSLVDVVEIPYPDEDAKGTRRGTMRNVKELLRRLGVQVRYNLISKEEEILIPNLASTLDNRANVTIAHIMDWCERCRIPSANLTGYLTALSDAQVFNPVATWIESEPWDGRSRLQELYDTIRAKDTVLKERLMRAWLISAVAAAYLPNGVSAHGVLVLQGDQYIGKTKWFKSLVPADLEVIADGVILRPDDKDSVFQVVSKWMVELGELDATFNKSDISQLKAFLTKDKDVIRRPYSRKESHYARRTVFFASVNEQSFLNDPTGNRRFWTIECERIDYNHRVNMQQLWAEVLQLFRAGETWYLSGQEILALNAHNEQFQAVEPVDEMVRTKFDWGDVRRDERTTTDICQQMGITHPTTKDVRVAARTILKLGASRRKTNGHWLYQVPPLIIGLQDRYSKRD